MKAALLVVLLITLGALSGTVLSVDNTPDPDSDHATPLAANSVAKTRGAPGIHGSDISNVNLGINKPLTLIVAGFFLYGNPLTQGIPHPSKTRTFTPSSFATLFWPPEEPR